jgi:Skp family chaperone for outer membrane proteins
MTSMKMNKPIAVIAAVLALALTSVAAVAQDHPFTEGAVINVEAIRTEHGRFDEYLKFLDTEWKATQEAAKKAGYITSYEVITVEPRGENDPDIYLVIYYKNWAALDGATAKRDAIAKEVDGSVSAADEAGSKPWENPASFGLVDGSTT